jgi:hypothetical protein
MYLREEYNEGEITNAIDANQQAMDLVYQFAISPIENELTEEQAKAISIAGLVLKTIAEKAYAYEQMQNGQDLQN